jgi:small subunit ribosomal protein S7
MSRRAAAPHRTILPDPKFGNDMLAKFINMVMERGKKSAAEKIVYGAIDRIGEKLGNTGTDTIAVLEKALDNVKPAVKPWPCAGSSKRRPIAAKNPWRSVSQPN